VHLSGAGRSRDLRSGVAGLLVASCSSRPGAEHGSHRAANVGLGGYADRFPWLVIGGKALTGWVVIDLDATLVTAHLPALATPF
jgi:hypothetical protein